MHKVKEILDELEREGERTTVRGCWYILVSKFPETIPNIHSRYSSYDRATVQARKDGFLEEDAFIDTVRGIVNINDDEYTSVEDQIDSVTYNVKTSASGYYIPRHYMQPNYQEIWIEKDALARFLDNIVNGKRDDQVNRQIRIVPNRGYTSRTYVKENINRLFRIWNRHYVKDIWIWYGGDLDPSGARMFENLKEEIMNSFEKWFLESLEKKELLDDPENFVKDFSTRSAKERRQAIVNDWLRHIHVEQFAVRPDQIQPFGLEHLQDPDPEVLFKLEGGIDPKTGKHKKGDSNTEWFRQKFGKGEVFQIEIDAMQARRTQFRRLILGLIDDHFDRSIYNLYVKDVIEESKETIRTQLRKILRELPDDWIK